MKMPIWFKRFLIKSAKAADNIIYPKLYITNCVSNFDIWKTRYEKYTGYRLGFRRNLNSETERENHLLFVIRGIINDPDMLEIFDYPPRQREKIHNFLLNYLNPANRRSWKYTTWQKVWELSEYNFHNGALHIEDQKLFESQSKIDKQFKNMMSEYVGI